MPGCGAAHEELRFRLYDLHQFSSRFSVALRAAPWPTKPIRPDEVHKDHELATIICAKCYVAASDQRFIPIVNPRAPFWKQVQRVVAYPELA